MKHARAVIFHFSLFEVEIFGLVIGQSHRQRHTIVVLIGTTATSTCGPKINGTVKLTVRYSATKIDTKKTSLKKIVRQYSVEYSDFKSTHAVLGSFCSF